MSSLFIAGERLADAVHRLQQSSARSRLVDYLILRRALVLQQATQGTDDEGASEVTLSMRDLPFMQALYELTAVARSAEADASGPADFFDPDTLTEHGGVDWPGRPYFQVLGTGTEAETGYRTKKYRSNGTADTVAKGPFIATGVVELVPNARPRAVRLGPGNVPGVLHELFVHQGSKPRLDDLACWWFRSTDLSDRFEEPVTMADLIAATIADLGLSEHETPTLFDTEPAMSPEEGLEETLQTVVTSDVAARPAEYLPVADFPLPPATEFGERVTEVIDYVAQRGFIYEPWHIAAYVTAVRTKPFVILAGISGTGKTKLPRLVAEATGAECRVVPVRPDWTDSSDLLGFERLDGSYVPGVLLRAARDAMDNPERQYFFLLDEMNIARVEYYLAEVLSHIEERTRTPAGHIGSGPLAPSAAPDGDGNLWSGVTLPSNLCIIGSVNMDETTHGFSRKVLDRSFVLEFSDFDLSKTGVAEHPQPVEWEIGAWQQPFLSLAEYPTPDDPTVLRVIATLTRLNEYLKPLQQQVGYRVRDEISLFCVNARDCSEAFGRSGGLQVDPLDLAVAMKVLPRLQGGGSTVRVALKRMLEWAEGRARTEANNEEALVEGTDLDLDEDDGTGDQYPLCAERLRLMLHRHDQSGYTSYWL